jgi:hypothetical protein
MGSGASTGSAGASAAAQAGVAAPGQAALLTVQPLHEASFNAGQPIQVETARLFEAPRDMVLRYSARQADGSPLPNWLSVNPATGVISGQAPEGSPRVVDVLVTVQNESGQGAESRVKLDLAVRR